MLSVETIDILNYDPSKIGFFDGIQNRNVKYKLIFSKFDSVNQFLNNHKNEEFGYTLGYYHINKFSSFLELLYQHLCGIKKWDITVQIILSKEIRTFDTALIGVIALFKSLLPDLKFIIEIPHTDNHETLFRFINTLSSLRKWYSDFYRISLYEILNNNNVYSDNSDLIERILPILQIDKDTYKELFFAHMCQFNLKELLSGIDSVLIISTIRKVKTESRLGKHLNKAEINYQILRSVLSELEPHLRITGCNKVFLFSYIKMISHFNLIEKDLISIDPLVSHEFNTETFIIKSATRDEMKEIELIFEAIQKELLNEPALHIYLFSIFYQRTILKQFETLKKFKEEIESLNHFTRSLVKGVKELAKNIIDHTEFKSGILCGRIYTKNDLVAVKSNFGLKDHKPDFETYIEELNANKTTDFLDLTIFDCGKLGFLQQTIKNLKELLHVDNKLLAKDLAELESGSITFRDFFSGKELKLNHQTIRALSHWGLISFVKEISRSKGFVFVSSNYSINELHFSSCYIYSGEAYQYSNVNSTFQTGTFYCVILPLFRGDAIRNLEIDAHFPKNESFSSENYLNLFKFKYVKLIDHSGQIDTIYLLQLSISEFISSNDLIGSYHAEGIKLGNRISDYLVSYAGSQQVIPVLDFEGLEDFFDEGMLIRLIGSLQLEIQIRSLIILNLKIELVDSLIKELSRINNDSKNLDFWGRGHFILLYSYKTKIFDSRTAKIYYASLLGGSTYNELFILNNKLSSTQVTTNRFNSSLEDQALSYETANALRSSPLFTSSMGVIQNFELIIKAEQKTLFDHNLEYTLNTNIDEEQDGYSGYTIKNSHFKLGSKAHIKDFVYAKRLFQNSFFANRIAFNISNYFLQTHSRIDSLTIIGYGEYSQLLINRIETILKHKLGTSKVNTNLVSDMLEPKLVKSDVPYDNAIVIVPINTTFSTTIKVEEALSKERSKNQNLNILFPSINIILVTHENLEDEEYVSRLNAFLETSGNIEDDDYPSKVFNWRKVDFKNKIVSVKTNPPNTRDTEHKYFVSIASQWYLPERCPMCFPPYTSLPGSDLTTLVYERPLLETDRTSVTPDLLLDIPDNYNLGNHKSFDEKLFINDEALVVKHISEKESHHYYFLDPMPFFEKNQEKILSWINVCRNAIPRSILHSPILLVAPSGRNNTYFIDLVNRMIFDDSAVIIHYDINGDYLENYQKFFKGNISDSAFIFFVDDFIQSGRSFNKVNTFVRFCNNQIAISRNEKIVNRGCNGVITLISKTDRFTLEDILSQLYLAEGLNFSNYNAFYFLSIGGFAPAKCPICFEAKRYQQLADDSILDTLKHYFLNKKSNLQETEIGDEDIKVYKPHVTGWEKFNPLVIENNDFPWADGAKDELKDLFSTFSKNSLPRRKYLRFLVQCSLNNLLCSGNNDLRRKMQLRLGYKNYLERKEQLINLFDEIGDGVLKDTPFLQLNERFNHTTRILFKDIVYELIHKILTTPPFSTVLCIREKVFEWTLILLEEGLDNVINEQEPSFRRFRKLKFLLKRAATLGSNYLLRYETLQKIQNIYNVHPLYNRKWYEKAITLKARYILNEYQVLTNELIKITKSKVQLSMEQEEIQFRLNYLDQSLRNLNYIEISVQEFSYYYSSLVKEITFNNSAKIITTEESIKEFISKSNSDAQEESDFYFLIRIIKYENSIILRNSIKSIYRQFIDKLKEVDFSYQIPAKFIRNLSALSFDKETIGSKLNSILLDIFNDYRYLYLWKYLKIKSVTKWRDEDPNTYDTFIRSIILYSQLMNEEPPQPTKIESNAIYTLDLEEKTKLILQSMFQITNENDSLINEDGTYLFASSRSSGAYLAIQYGTSQIETIPYERIVVSSATDPFEKDEYKEIINAPIDADSLTYTMMNGINSRQSIVAKTISSYLGNEYDKILIPLNEHPSKPWMIWVLRKDKNTNDWYSRRLNVRALNPRIDEDFLKLKNKTNKINNDFTEALFLSDNVNSLTFVRLADLSVTKGKPYLISYKANAIIGFFSEKLQPTEDKLKFGLWLLPEVNKFITKHYDNEILASLIKERKDKIQAKSNIHGYHLYLEALTSLALRNSKGDTNSEFVSLLKSILRPGIDLLSLISIQRKIGIHKTEIENRLKTIGREANQVKRLNYEKLTLQTLKERILKYLHVILGNNFETGESEPFKIKDYKVEIDFGSLNSSITILTSSTLLDIMLAEALINFKKSQSLSFRVEIRVEKELVCLNFLNTATMDDPKEIKKINKQNLKSTHGVGLIKFIAKEWFDFNVVVESSKIDEELSKKLSLDMLSINDLLRIFSIKFPIASYETDNSDS